MVLVTVFLFVSAQLNSTQLCSQSFSLHCSLQLALVCTIYTAMCCVFLCVVCECCKRNIRNYLQLKVQYSTRRDGNRNRKRNSINSIGKSICVYKYELNRPNTNVTSEGCHCTSTHFYRVHTCIMYMYTSVFTGTLLFSCFLCRTHT